MLTKKQQTILNYVYHPHNNDPLHIINEGAVRSGKTYIDNLLFTVHVHGYKNENKDFIITGHTIGSIERNILKPYRDDFGIDTRLDKHNRFNMSGNRIHCFGTDKMDSYKSITGMTSYGWYGNEVTLSHPNAISEVFNRCSGDGFRIIWDTNPGYPDHPIKINYIDKSGDKLESGRIRIKSFHFEIEDNTYLTKEYVENLKASTPPGMWYNRKIKGMWVAAEGVIYENFDKEIHVVEPFKIPDDWERVRGIDFGYVHPFVMLWGAIDNDGRLYIYKEHVKSKMLIAEHAKIIKNNQDIDKNGINLYYRFTVADHDAQERAEYVRHDVFTSPAIKDVRIGIQKVAERLVVQKDGKPRLYLFNTCKKSITGMSRYVWQERREGKPYKEEPLKVNDDEVDVVRYIVMELDKGSLTPSLYTLEDLGL